MTRLPVRLTTLADLKHLGLSESFIERLARNIGGSKALPLTSLQCEALGDASLTGDSNLLIAGPTSAGKTMVATVLAELTSKSRRLEKVLYVVPLRALVTEKYAEWQTIFADSIVIPISSDYPRSDHISRTGRWDIAIIVFEKLYQWLAESSLARTLMSQLSLVILDELQCVGETGRGEKLEMVVALLRHYQQNNRKENGLLPFRLVGMGVSREIATGLQRWLDASILPQEAVSRPIPLLEAKLSRRQGDMTLYDEASGAIVDAAAAPPLIRTLLEGAPRYV